MSWFMPPYVELNLYFHFLPSSILTYQKVLSVKRMYPCFVRQNTPWHGSLMKTGLRENDLMCIVSYTLKWAYSRQLHTTNEIPVDKFGTPAKKSVDRCIWPTHSQFLHRLANPPQSNSNVSLFLQLITHTLRHRLENCSSSLMNWMLRASRKGDSLGTE